MIEKAAILPMAAALLRRKGIGIASCHFATCLFYLLSCRRASTRNAIKSLLALHRSPSMKTRWIISAPNHHYQRRENTRIRAAAAHGNAGLTTGGWRDARTTLLPPRICFRRNTVCHLCYNQIAISANGGTRVTSGLDNTPLPNGTAS